MKSCLLFVSIAAFIALSSPLLNSQENIIKSDDHRLSLRACDGSSDQSTVSHLTGESPSVAIVLWGRKVIEIAPLFSNPPAGELARYHFDYAVQSDPAMPPEPISRLGTSDEERDNLANRTLNSVGVSCVDNEDAIVYLGFATFGSLRDYIYVGLRLGKHFGGPWILGESRFGVLVIDPHKRDAFSIWDCDEDTVADGMLVKHIYHISHFLWGTEAAKVSPTLRVRMRSRDVHPSEVMFQNIYCIRIGEPKVRVYRDPHDGLGAGTPVIRRITQNEAVPRSSRFLR